jgi:hypothetical protein
MNNSLKIAKNSGGKTAKVLQNALTFKAAFPYNYARH